jgi:hypothetical protein
MMLSQALTVYANNRSARTVPNTMVLEFFDLDAEASTTQTELRIALKPWEGRFVMQWLDDAHAFAVFTDTHARAEVKRALNDRFNMNAPTRGKATAKAEFAFRTAYLEREGKPQRREAESKADAAETWRRGDAWDDLGEEEGVGKVPVQAPIPQASWDDEADAAPVPDGPVTAKYVPPNLRTGDDAMPISASTSTTASAADAELGPAKYTAPHLRAGSVAIGGDKKKTIAKLSLAAHPFGEKSKPPPPSNAYSLLMEDEEENERGSLPAAIVPKVVAAPIEAPSGAPMTEADMDGCVCRLVINSGHMEGCTNPWPSYS